jgi:hypothetical protein
MAHFGGANGQTLFFVNEFEYRLAMNAVRTVPESKGMLIDSLMAFLKRTSG